MLQGICIIYTLHILSLPFDALLTTDGVAVFQILVTYSSTYVLVALSIDRCDAITHPMNFTGSCEYTHMAALGNSVHIWQLWESQYTYGISGKLSTHMAALRVWQRRSQLSAIR